MTPLITGIGLVTPLGNSLAQTWQALLAGQYIRDHARSRLHAESPDRVDRLATAAAKEACADARWIERWAGARTALVVGTSKGAVESWMTPPPASSDNPIGACAAFGLAATAARLRKAFPSMEGPTLTLSAACASGLHALIRASMLITSGEADRVLVIAAEASVHPLFLASFHVSKLPWVMVAAAVLTVLVVLGTAKSMARHGPRRLVVVIA